MTEPVSPRAPDRRAPLAALLSFLFPGLGQAWNGERTLAWILAGPPLLLVAVAASVVLLASSTLVALLLDASFLLALIVLDLALLGWRLMAISQAYLRRERPGPRRWTSWVAAGLLALTVGMHALPAWYAVLTIDTLNAVTLGGGGRDDGPGEIPGFSPLPRPSDEPDVTTGERVNVLLVGIDSAPHRSTQLTDTMMVVSLDTRGTVSAMISVPRDLYGAPLPDGRFYKAKLNSLMVYAERRPDEFPMGGVATLKATIGELLGVRIHYFAAINLLGFKQAVDAIGGVDVNVRRAISDPTYRNEFGERTGFFLEPGPIHMDGSVALAYVRSRKGTGDNDFTRADRQQELLAAVRAKLTAGNLLVALPGLLDAVKNTIASDVPRDRLTVLAEAVQEADMSRLRRIVLQPPKYMTADPYSPAGYILVPDLAAIRAIGEELLTEPTPGPSPIARAAGALVGA